MGKLATVKNAVIGGASKVKFAVGKHSPELLLGGGLICIGVGVVLACKETLVVDEILDEHEEKRSKIEEVHETVNEEDSSITYTEQNYQHDKFVLTVQTGVKILRNYAPSIAFLGVGVACIVSSYGIMKKRNVALVAAYNAVDTAFKAYRQRVVEEQGEEADVRYMYGTKQEEKEVVKEDGTTETAMVPTAVSSQYARWFDKCSCWYSPVPSANLMFLRGVHSQSFARLKLNGHLFLNEVYDALDIPRSPEGQAVGWIYDPSRGEEQLDFHIYDAFSDGARKFVNGVEKEILLDFNVQGPIYDKINKNVHIRVR